MSTIVTIVEGPGEVDAMPILIRRIAATAVPDAVPHEPRPIRVKRDRFLKENELERYVDLAARQSGPDGGVLIVLDADDDCPPELASRILQRANRARGDRLIKVVLARREYEAVPRSRRLDRSTPRAPKRHHPAQRRRVDSGCERMADLTYATRPGI